MALFSFLPFPIWYIPIALLLSYILFAHINRYVFDRRARRLGYLPPRVKTYLPLSLDFPFKAMYMLSNQKAMQAWLNELYKLGALDTKNYTMDLNVMHDIRVIFTADPENTKAILATQFADYGKGEQFHEEWKDFLGDSILTSDGKKWSDARALLRPLFLKEKVADLELFEEHIQELLKHLGPGDGRQVDARNLMFRFALDASTHFLFGHSAGSLKNERTKFALAFDEVQRLQALAGRAGPVRHFINMKTFHEGLKLMEQFIEPWIEEALDLSEEELEVKSKRQDTLLHALARQTRDRKVFRDNLMALLLAGRDTTSTTLSWTILELARHPEVVKKIQAEIAEVVGVDGGLPTYENIKNMKYLTWVINETLRLYPVVPFNVRTALRDTTLPRGGGPDGKQPIGVLANTAIGYSTLIMQRRRDLYPPISEKFPFDPEEWVPERWKTWYPESWHFVPFNGGPRICLGQQFALVEMAYVLIRLLTEYDRIVDYGNDNVKLGVTIVLSPYPGVNVGFVKDN
ncbi:hypothetical protein LTR66_016007 [Elasticomyces elasticus]|nr:hypothetical protein LTR66_016007 [Elasticomyces elasticus]